MPISAKVVRIPVNGVQLNTAILGSGPALLLLHGFPHTWRLWSEVMEPLSHQWQVIAPDLRGMGDSSRAADGYDAANLATDFELLLAALGHGTAAIVATDAAVAPAFLLAMRRPELVRQLVLFEGLLGRLPGAESFVAGGPPWWFGFHAVPDLAERVLLGHEAEYVDWFLKNGTMGRGIDPAIRDAFVAAYTGTESLRCAFEHYRAMPTTTRQLEAAVAGHKLRVPTLAIGAHPVGAALHHQLGPVTQDLRTRMIEGCGHIAALDRPQELLRELLEFLEPSKVFENG